MPRRRLATSLAFATLFFAGASFSALGGDQTVRLLEEDLAQDPAAQTAAPEELASEAAGEDDEQQAEPAAPPDPAAAPPEAESPELNPAEAALQPELAETPAEAEAPAPEEAAAPADPDLTASIELDGADFAPVQTDEPAAAPAAAKPSPRPATRRAPKALKAMEPDPEVDEPGVSATIWLNRVLADPTPRSLRLKPKLARKLARASKAAGVPWALVLGTIRAGGSRLPDGKRMTIAETAAALVEFHTEAPEPATTEPAMTQPAEPEPGARDAEWYTVLALTGEAATADRAVALADYYRAVGLRALVKGLRAQQERLAKRILADLRIELYPGGRIDIDDGRVDVRVLALIAYLAERYDQITISSLISGHRIYSRPGVVSAHVYGHAIDIASLGGQSIYGNQEPGGLTERAVRDILLLPAEVRPRQLISLLGMGGPSFPLADHDDHIHAGF